LNKYEGSYILVSHDRYFISKTANKIWEIVDHEIKEFKGGYEEYVQWKERMAKSNVESSKSNVKVLKSNVQSSKPEMKPEQPSTLNVKPSTLTMQTANNKKELQKAAKTIQ
jgi:ATP-binding cassette subfamily F protein 3